MPFLSDAGIGARVAEPVAAAEHDSEEEQLLESEDASDYADQFPYPGSINNENLEILAAILKQIPECIDTADLDRLSDLLPHMETVQVATRTVQEAIAVRY